MQDISIPSLYRSNENFELVISENRDEWLKNRSSRIGGSEASSLIGKNKYQSLRDLWLKKKKVQVEEIQSNELIEYGNDCEPILRQLYAIKHKDIEVQYMENVSLYSKKYEFMSYSPDGLLKDGERKGILEIKTSSWRKIEEWRTINKENRNGIEITSVNFDRIPDNYLYQVLWGLIVTNYDFVDLIAEINQFDGNSRIVQYHIERIDFLLDIECLLETSLNNWDKYFVNDIKPSLMFEL